MDEESPTRLAKLEGGHNEEPEKEEAKNESEKEPAMEPEKEAEEKKEDKASSEGVYSLDAIKDNLGLQEEDKTKANPSEEIKSVPINSKVIEVKKGETSPSSSNKTPTSIEEKKEKTGDWKVIPSQNDKTEDTFIPTAKPLNRFLENKKCEIIGYCFITSTHFE